ncbi:hypothetical protein ACVNSY_03310 [Bacillus sp. OHL2]
MPYKAYRDINKTLEIRACDTTIEDTKKTFYCSTKDCKALMTLVNGGDSERAHFRRRSSSPKHSSIFCSADGNFASTEYDEYQFNFDDISTKLIDPPSKPKRKVGKGTTTLTGGGGKSQYLQFIKSTVCVANMIHIIITRLMIFLLMKEILLDIEMESKEIKLFNAHLTTSLKMSLHIK